MAGVERVTVTLPDDLARDIDLRDNDRDSFVAEAVRRELDRRRRVELRLSIENPHSETVAIAEEALEDWTNGLPEEDAAALVDSSGGTSVRWIAGEGWVEDRS